MIIKLLKANFFLGLVLGVGLFYNVILFNNIDLILYGRFTMMLVYINFIGAFSFSPFMEGMQVFYRERSDIRYFQLSMVISLFYSGVYLLLGSLLILIFYGNLGNFTYFLPLSFALGPVSSLIRGFMVIEDRLNMTYIIDFFAVSLQVAILTMFSEITLNHLLLLHFTGHTGLGE